MSGQDGVPDVQVIASSPRPLDAAVAEGMLRSDLFYLLCSTTLIVPPLSERLEDIPVLARHFLSRIRPEISLTLAPDALEALQDANWPGHVRQLKNVLEQAAELSLTPVIPESAIRRVILDYSEENLAAFDDARREFERDYLVRLLQTTAGNVAQAARVAQRNRTEFYKLLARHGLDPINFKQKFR
jgi:two-component system response regulator GlrR